MQGARLAGGKKQVSFNSQCISVSRHLAALAHHLSNDFAALRVPHEGTIVLSTRHEEISVLLAPREGEDSLVMAGENLFWRSSVAQIPEHDDRGGVLAKRDKGDGDRSVREARRDELWPLPGPHRAAHSRLLKRSLDAC